MHYHPDIKSRSEHVFKIRENVPSTKLSGFKGFWLFTQTALLQVTAHILGSGDEKGWGWNFNLDPFSIQMGNIDSVRLIVHIPSRLCNMLPYHIFKFNLQL